MPPATRRSTARSRRKQDGREDYIGTTSLLPELIHLGRWSFTKAVVSGLQAHQHEAAFEVCYIAEGSVDWWASETIYEVPSGWFYITLPNEIHGALHAVIQPSVIYWAIVAIPPGGPLPGLTSEQSLAIERSLSSLKHRSFPAPHSVRALFETMLGEHRVPATQSALLARSVLHQLLVYAVRCHDEYAEKRPDTLSPSLKAAVSKIDAGMDESITTQELAAAAGMSTSAFHARFLLETGFTPGAFRTKRRIGKAKQLLLEGQASITEIALELGFGNSQYFATVFKRLTGLTPSAYRRRFDKPFQGVEENTKE